jgi:predicted small lipoprotein YifL
MKKSIVSAIILLLTLALLASCGKPQTQLPDPTKSTAEITTTPTGTLPTEDDTEYEGDASSYYIDVVYHQQIERYHTAISQQWDESAYFDHEMSVLAAHYYDEKSLDNIGFTFMDLDGDGIWELIIGAIKNAERDPLIFEIWALKNDEPVMIAQSGSNNRYYLQYSQEDDAWYVANEGSNGAANSATYYLMLIDGKLEVMQGIVYDAMADQENPWFMAYDLDWDVSNDEPIDEEMANAILDNNRRHYTAVEYIPYSLYK